MTNKHTELPWRTGEKFGRIYVGDGSAEIDVCDCRLAGINAVACSTMIAANAAFIVQACNAHEELVEALKGLLSAMETSEEFSDGSNEDMKAAYAALSKVGGE